MKLICTHCKQEFQVSPGKQKIYDEAKASGDLFVMLACEVCDRGFSIPLRPLDPPPEGEENFRCPESRCTGIVSFIKDEDDDFWGCGECGSVWRSDEDFQDAIQVIIKAFPFRKKVYKIKDHKFHPVPSDKEPEDYDEVVEEEVEL